MPPQGLIRLALNLVDRLLDWIGRLSLWLLCFAHVDRNLRPREDGTVERFARHGVRNGHLVAGGSRA